MMASILSELRELCSLATVKGVLAVLAAWAMEMVGHPDSAARWLFLLMVLDLCLGLARAWKRRQIRGRRLTRGAFKFFRYWLAVAVFVMADATLKKAFPAMPVSLRDTFIAYLAINEAFSCVDHLAFFGMPIPEGFLNRLRHYREAAICGDWDGVDRRSSNAAVAGGRTEEGKDKEKK